MLTYTPSWLRDQATFRGFSVREPSGIMFLYDTSNYTDGPWGRGGFYGDGFCVVGGAHDGCL